jgi:hypothetical protein
MTVRKINHRSLSEIKDDFRVVKATDTINKKGLEASYMVSYWVARTGKPHTIVEDLILPAAADMAGTMLGEKANKNYTDNVFIKQHCFTTHPWHGRRCFETITALHTFTFKSFSRRSYPEPVNDMRYSWMSQQGLAEHLVYVRYIYEGWIKFKKCNTMIRVLFKLCRVGPYVFRDSIKMNSKCWFHTAKCIV